MVDRVRVIVTWRLSSRQVHAANSTLLRCWASLLSYHRWNCVSRMVFRPDESSKVHRGVKKLKAARGIPTSSWLKRSHALHDDPQPLQADIRDSRTVTRPESLGARVTIRIFRTPGDPVDDCMASWRTTVPWRCWQAHPIRSRSGHLRCCCCALVCWNGCGSYRIGKLHDRPDTSRGPSSIVVLTVSS